MAEYVDPSAFRKITGDYVWGVAHTVGPYQGWGDGPARKWSRALPVTIGDGERHIDLPDGRTVELRQDDAGEVTLSILREGVATLATKALLTRSTMGDKPRVVAVVDWTAPDSADKPDPVAPGLVTHMSLQPTDIF